MKAKYDGRCPKCRKKITKGKDDIEREDADDPGSRWVHAACLKPIGQEGTLARYNGKCPKCRKKITKGKDYVIMEYTDDGAERWTHTTCVSPIGVVGSRRPRKDARKNILDGVDTSAKLKNDSKPQSNRRRTPPTQNVPPANPGEPTYCRTPSGPTQDNWWGQEDRHTGLQFPRVADQAHIPKPKNPVILEKGMQLKWQGIIGWVVSIEEKGVLIDGPGIPPSTLIRWGDEVVLDGISDSLTKPPET